MPVEEECGAQVAKRERQLSPSMQPYQRRRPCPTHSSVRLLWGPRPCQPSERSMTCSLRQVPLRMASCTSGSSRRLSGGANW